MAFPFCSDGRCCYKNLPEGVTSECLFADDLIFPRLTFKPLLTKTSLHLKNLFLSPSIVNGITMDGLSESKVDPCGICSLIVKANPVLCVQCGKWMHCRCVRVKMVTAMFQRILHAENVKEILEAVQEFTYLGERMSADGG